MRIILFFITLIISESIFSQTAENTVTLTTSGTGKTLEEAKNNALRSAIEQAFGAFISSKTEILNDQLVSDQITSVSSGNIQKFEIKSESKLPNDIWCTTLTATVSVDKLISFVQAKGVTVEIKGGLFALNVKQQLLNETAEVKIIFELIGCLHESLQAAFDYKLESGNPRSLDAQSVNWEIPLEITAIANENMDFCAEYFIKTLTSTGLSDSELSDYKSLNKSFYPIKISFNGKTSTVYLRKKISLDAIKYLSLSWENYIRLFTVSEGSQMSHGIGKGMCHSLNEMNKLNIYQLDMINEIEVNFPHSGLNVASLRWNDKRSLSQIEQMTRYSIKPRGVISEFKNGGYVVYEANGHGLVVSTYDLGDFNWKDAKSTCENLNIGGYTDWSLPTREQFLLIYKNLYGLGFGGFLEDQKYWSSESVEGDEAYVDPSFVFRFDAVSFLNEKTVVRRVRAVRIF